MKLLHAATLEASMCKRLHKTPTRNAPVLWLMRAPWGTIINSNKKAHRSGQAPETNVSPAMERIEIDHLFRC